MTRATISRGFVLPAKPEDFAGEVRVSVTLENLIDVELAKRDIIAGDAVRSVTVDILVDTGASLLVLPRDIVESLGLEMRERAIVEFADGRHEEVDIAGTVLLSVSGRSAETRCIVGPAGTEPLLGQIVLEILDLLVDCPRHQLVPRPESPHMASYKLKIADSREG